MNPNSQNQTWSSWVWFVVPGRTIERPFIVVCDACTKFVRKAFGSGTQINIVQTRRGYIIKVLTEGHPVHDQNYLEHMKMNWEKFLTNGFGLGTKIKMSAKLMAGSRQDGTPPDQMIILPQIGGSEHE